MNSFPKYPSIENLHKVIDILKYKCVLSEKLHGTNVRFMWSPKEGGLVIGSRENIIYKAGQRNGELYGFTDYMIDLFSKDDVFFHNNASYDNYVFYGEWFGDGVQKGVKYCNGKSLRIFDIRDPEGNLLDWEKVKEISHEVGFQTVPEIDTGIFDINYLESVRDSISALGKQNGFNDPNNIWEGIVLKPFHMQRDKHGEWLIAKYKSEKFAENVKAPKVRTVDPAKIDLRHNAQVFAESTCTYGRVITVIDHITRTGNQILDMKRTPEFLRELVNDITKEYADMYNSLDNNQKKEYNKAVSNLGGSLWKKEVEERNLKGV